MFRPMRRKSGELEKSQTIELLKNEKRGVLAMIGDNGYPYSIPINYLFEEESMKIYFHGAKEGHKVDAIRNNDKICFTVYGNPQYKENDWAPYLESAVIFGRAKLISDESLTKIKLRKFAEKYYPSKEEIDRVFDKEIDHVQLFEINIEHISGKRIHEK